jgi:TetR/AcrR family transcriptional regulator, transcriptional repressor for nem operon
MVGRPKGFDRDEALTQAVDVFWANGYEATSLDELTAGMGIGRGSLYNEFGSKHALFVEALDRYRGERFAASEATLANAPTARAGIETLFRGTVERLWGDPARRGCLLVNSAAELAAGDPAVAARAKESFDRFAQLFRSALERGQREGELDGRLDVTATARYLSSAFLGLRLLAKVTDRRAAEGVVDVTLRVLDP